MSFKSVEEQLKRDIRNAMNRTLTKVAKEQRQILHLRLNVKKKYLHSKRLQRYNAKLDDLRIRITSTPKHITPFMLINPPSQKLTGYGIVNKKDGGGKFMVRAAYKGKGNPSGFIVSESKIYPQKRDKKMDIYYLQKVANLDDEALKIVDELTKKAHDFFVKEIQK